VGEARGSLFGWRYEIQDYNSYRMAGHSGRFEAGTGDRAVSVTTCAAYEAFRQALGDGGPVNDGDFGENVLVSGPPAVAGADGTDGLQVGDRLHLGSAVIELTEANAPCYRFNREPWSARAKAVWGGSAPDGNAEKWFKAPSCPLCPETYPGGRGWLAKVLVEGDAREGDAVERERRPALDPLASRQRGKTAVRT